MEYGTDPFNLHRFINAQDSIFDLAQAEIEAGQKRSHWMWFIFPQIRGLGSSEMAKRFAISGMGEGAAYLEHPTLGRRLEKCTALINAFEDRSVHDVFGHPDDLKFHSSITLFANVAEEFRFDTAVFKDALRKHFSGLPDPETLRLLTNIGLNRL